MTDQATIESEFGKIKYVVQLLQEQRNAALNAIVDKSVELAQAHAAFEQLSTRHNSVVANKAASDSATASRILELQDRLAFEQSKNAELVSQLQNAPTVETDSEFLSNILHLLQSKRYRHIEQLLTEAMDLVRPKTLIATAQELGLAGNDPTLGISTTLVVDDSNES